MKRKPLSYARKYKKIIFNNMFKRNKGTNPDIFNKTSSIKVIKNLENKGNLNGITSLKTKNKKGDWSEHEELLVFWYAKTFSCSWIKISSEIRNRSRVAIRNKFVNLFKNNKFSSDECIFHNLILERKVRNAGGVSPILTNSEDVKEQFMKKRLLFQLIIHYLLNSDPIGDAFARKMFILIFDKSEYKRYTSAKLTWNPKLVDFCHFIKTHLTKVLNLMKPHKFKPLEILKINNPIEDRKNIYSTEKINYDHLQKKEQDPKNEANRTKTAQDMFFSKSTKIKYKII